VVFLVCERWSGAFVLIKYFNMNLQWLIWHKLRGSHQSSILRADHFAPKGQNYLHLQDQAGQNYLHLQDQAYALFLPFSFETAKRTVRTRHRRHGRAHNENPCRNPGLSSDFPRNNCARGAATGSSARIGGQRTLCRALAGKEHLAQRDIASPF